MAKTVKKDPKVRPKRPVKRHNDFAEVVHEYHPRPVKKTWRQIIYDKETGEVFERTGMSWARLGLFYMCFYGVLAILCTICMQGLFATLTTEYPKWQLEESRIGTNPGMTIRPSYEDDEGRSFITYRLSDPSSIKLMIDMLDKFLRRKF